MIIFIVVVVFAFRFQLVKYISSELDRRKQREISKPLIKKSIKTKFRERVCSGGASLGGE